MGFSLASLAKPVHSPLILAISGTWAYRRVGADVWRCHVNHLPQPRLNESIYACRLADWDDYASRRGILPTAEEARVADRLAWLADDAGNDDESYPGPGWSGDMGEPYEPTAEEVAWYASRRFDGNDDSRPDPFALELHTMPEGDYREAMAEIAAMEDEGREAGAAKWACKARRREAHRAEIDEAYGVRAGLIGAES